MSSHSSNRDAAVDVSAGSSALPFWMAQLRGLTTWPSWRKDIPQLRMTVAEDCINSMDLLRCLTGKNTNRYIRKPSRGTFCFISELLPVGKSQPWSLGVASLSLRNAARVVTGRFPASWCRNGASIGMLRGFGWSVGFKRSGWGFDQFFLSTKKKAAVQTKWVWRPAFATWRIFNGILMAHGDLNQVIWVGFMGLPPQPRKGPIITYT
jgi:hypothetical protein